MDIIGIVILALVILFVIIPSPTEVREAMKRKERSKRKD